MASNGLEFKMAPPEFKNDPKNREKLVGLVGLNDANYSVTVIYKYGHIFLNKYHYHDSIIAIFV